MNLKDQKVVYLDKTEDGYEGQLENGTRIVFLRHRMDWSVGTGSSFKQAYNNQHWLGDIAGDDADELITFLGMERL